MDGLVREDPVGVMVPIVASAGRSRSFEESVRRVVAGLAPGEVATYGEVAEEAGYPGAARAVGSVLARSDGLPWWRVVTSTGRLVPSHEEEHERLLLAEGIRIEHGHVRPARANR